MNLIAFIGTGLISKAIQWQTRSVFSHVALELSDGEVIEAWHRGGVKRYPGRDALAHHKGSRAQVFWIEMTQEQEKKAEAFLKGQIGKPYDFLAIARFLSRRPMAENGRWFCSELAAAACCYAGYRLQHTEPHLLSPRDVVMSPRIIYRETVLL